MTEDSVDDSSVSFSDIWLHRVQLLTNSAHSQDY